VYKGINNKTVGKGDDISMATTSQLSFGREIVSFKMPTKPGANPATSIYNTSVVNFYNATGSLASFSEN
jgi:hypothetical protein